MLTSVLVCVVLSACLVSQVTPLPTGAIACPEGVAAVAGPHIASNPLPGSGTLSAGGFQVTIDDTPLDPETAFPISVGTTYNVKIQGTGTMRGFLIRASGGSTSVDTVSAFGIDTPEATQVAQSCLSQVTPVGGLTHTNNAEKAEAGGTLSFTEPASDVMLDITVVERLVGSDSTYYHTSYKLDVM